MSISSVHFIRRTLYRCQGVPFSLFIKLETSVRRLGFGSLDPWSAMKIARAQSVEGEVVREREREQVDGPSMAPLSLLFAQTVKIAFLHPTQLSRVSRLEQASPIDSSRGSTTIAANSNRPSFRRPFCQIDIAYPNCVPREVGMWDAEVKAPPNSP